MGLKRLRLDTLKSGMPAITPAFGGMLAEAGAVCFDKQGHKVGVPLAVGGTYKERFRVYWPTVTQQMRCTYFDLQEAVEHGAYGVAILLVKRLTGQVAIERSVKGPGFDYWVGRADTLPFQKKGRLEVSGILQGVKSNVQARLAQKENQTKASDGKFPAYVAIVEFGRPESVIKRR